MKTVESITLPPPRADWGVITHAVVYRPDRRTKPWHWLMPSMYPKMLIMLHISPSPSSFPAWWGCRGAVWYRIDVVEVARTRRHRNKISIKVKVQEVIRPVSAFDVLTFKEPSYRTLRVPTASTDINAEVRACLARAGFASINEERLR